MQKNERNIKNKMEFKKGKKELYSFVYKRIWDLEKFDGELLKKYGLKKAKYVYIGSCKDYNLKAKNSKFRYAIKHGGHNKKLRSFLRALETFYKREFKFNKYQLDYYLYYNSEIITRCESLKGARKLEKAWAGHYKFLEQFNDISDSNYILMSDKDCCFKEYYYKGVNVLHYKKL